MRKLKAFIFDTFVVIVVFLVVLIASIADLGGKQSDKNSMKGNEISSNINQKKDTDSIRNQEEKELQKMGDKIAEESKKVEELKKHVNNSEGKVSPRDWNNIVIDYNNKLLAYNKDMDEYNSKLEAYNKKNNQHKLLAEKDESIVMWLKSIIGIE